MSGFRVVVHLQGLFRVVQRGQDEVLAVAPPTRFLSSERNENGQPKADDGREEARPHEFYVEWDPRRTRTAPPEPDRPDVFPAMKSIWNVRGARVRFHFDASVNPLDFDPGRLSLPEMVSDKNGVFPTKLEDAVRVKDEALKDPGSFTAPGEDPNEEVTAERVVGQVLIDQGTATPGDLVHLETRFEPDLLEGTRTPERSDLNNSVLFVHENPVEKVTVEALDLVTGLRLGAVELTTAERRLDIFVKHICPDYVLRREPERLPAESSRDSDFVWLYELSNDKQRLVDYVRATAGADSTLPVPVRDGDPQAGGTAQCGSTSG